MIVELVKIGNSKGIRLPSTILKNPNVSDKMELTVDNDGTITLKPIKKINDLLVISENSLAKDWLRPEEDEAWANL
jgi:antitoxin component of MazEF toxin-antitoxin module